MTGERLKVILGLLVISTVWGSTWLVIKLGLEELPPFFGAGMRFMIAIVFLFGFIRARRLTIHWTTDAKKLYLAMGLLSFSIPFALVYWAEQYISSGLGSILFAVYPFWVAIFSHLFLKSEPMDRYKVAGITLGFLGITTIFWSDLDVANPRAALGMGAMVASTILQAYMLILIKRYGQPISPFVMNFVGMSIGGPVLLLLSYLTESWGGITWSGKAAGSILYLALVGSVLAFGTYYWLLKRIEAVYLSLTSLVNPIVAVVLGSVVLGEQLGISVAAGAALVLLGILVANGKYFHEKYA